MLLLFQPVIKTLGLPKNLTPKLEKLRIFTIEDLLYHFPSRYDDFSVCKKINELKAGEEITLKGKITKINRLRSYRSRALTEAFIADETGQLRAVWFGFSKPLTFLKEGKYIRLSGKITLGKDWSLTMQHPNFEIIAKNQIKPEEEQIILLDDDIKPQDQTPAETEEDELCIKPSNNNENGGILVPIYPETEGLNSFWFRKIIKKILFNSQIIEFIPKDILKDEKLIDLKEALLKIHLPKNHTEIDDAKKRFAFEKMFLIQLRVLSAKKQWETQKALEIPFNESFIQNFVAKLPYQLTGAQKKSAWQIIQDLRKNTPMNRLLEGDVGSGKTIVAAIALLSTAKSCHQAAMLAPTEILATQHFEAIKDHFSQNSSNEFNPKIALLTGSQALINDKKISKKELKETIEKGEIKIIIGTHALLQETVKFNSLALIIIDEQHRFGVNQRAFLQQQTLKISDGKEKTIPHLLTMTATPIPRTLSLAVFGNLDLSIIDEYPKNRRKIITRIISPKNRDQAYNFIKNEIKNGRQIFVICPLVEESEKLTEVKNAKNEFEYLQNQIFPEFKVSLIHGKMKSTEKESIMNDFKNKKTHILVATSVIEVGINIPNASIMLIEGAERFGLSQLHQFRGRVGRGKHQSYCLLFTSGNNEATRRLKALEETCDGFKIAQYDLEFRGPGQFLGTNQSGQADLAMEALSDVKTIQAARIQANRILNFDEKLEKFPLLRKQLEKLEQITHWE